MTRDERAEGLLKDIMPAFPPDVLKLMALDDWRRVLEALVLSLRAQS